LKNWNSEKVLSFGINATKVYLAILFLGIPLSRYFGWVKFEPLTLNEIGDFLAGAFGPIAFLWLVLGFLLQSKELRNSVEALTLQTEELRASVAQQSALVEVSEKQHQLELEYKEEKIKEERISKIPEMLIKSSGGSVSGKQSSLKYQITNRAGDASAVRLKTIASSELGTDCVKVSPSPILSLRKGEKRDIIITAEGNVAHYSILRLEIHSKAVAGGERKTVIDLKDEELPITQEQVIFADGTILESNA